MPALLRVQGALRQAGLGLACVLLFLIMLIGGADALSSNLIGHPLPAVLELTEVLLAASVFLALASAGADHKHIIVDVFTTRMTGRGQRICAVFGWLVGVLIFSAMALQAWKLALDSVAARETASALIRFPIWPAKLLAAFGVTIAASQCLLDLVVAMRPAHR